MDITNAQDQDYFLDKQHSEIVVESNDLVEASYRLSLNEQRLILCMASKIKKDDSDFRILKISVMEFAEIFDLDYRNTYKELKKVTESLTTKNIRMKSSKSENKEGYLVIAWLSSAEYINGVLELEFSEKMKPYLLQLKNNFAQYTLGEFVKFKSTYSIRLYQILKRYVGFRDGSRYYTIEELRKMLGVKDKYPKYSNFNARVLSTAIKEINEVSGINIEAYEDKIGRKVRGIKFVVTSKVNEVEENTAPEVEVNTDLIITVKTLLQTVCPDTIVGDKEAAILLKEANNDVTMIMQKIMIVQQSKSKIDNVMGFLIDGIRNDYNPINLEGAADATKKNWNYSDDSAGDDFESLARQSRNR